MADYDYASDDWSDPDDEAQLDDTEIEIQNNYHEADEIKHSKPTEALQKFEVVVMLEENSDRAKWKFKALQNIVALQAKLGSFQEMLKSHRKLLKQVNSVSRNEASEAIDYTMEALGDIEDSKVQEEFYKITLDTLKNTNEKLWYSLTLKMARLQLTAEKYDEVLASVISLKDLLRSKPLNEQTKSQLLDVISVEIQACERLQDGERIKALQEEVAPLLNVAILEPRPMGVIKESSGKLAMRMKNWELALSDFNSAFQFYQDIGDHQAKQILKYVVLAGILSKSDINPFESKEAKAFKDDPQILAMIRLRDSFEENDIFATRQVLKQKSNHISDDPFLAEFMEELITNIELNVLNVKIRSYSRVKIATLARAIGEDVGKTERLLSVLILDQRTNGMIDQIGGFFERDVSTADSQLQDSFAGLLSQLENSLARSTWGRSFGY